MTSNRTVQRAIDFLVYIAAHPGGVSMDELCEYFSIPRTSAYVILVTLVQSGMLEVISGNRQLYRTGILAYQIGMSYPDASDELKLIGSSLHELAVKSDRTAFFGKLSGDKVLYLLKEVPENPIITTATVGSTAPLYCTSLGKTLLTYLPEEETAGLLNQMEFLPRTERTIHSQEQLLAELSLTRSRGYAMDFREYEDHMVCVSAPIYRRDGSLAGAVSISGFYRPEDDYETYGRLIRQEAAEISRLLGYRKDNP
ncbi:MAG: IclR family transcriptional regulator [Lachnospiraceae bacterium]|nr:IclR family transcriptional regulator [Lachnospiraceae bacterium]